MQTLPRSGTIVNGRLWEQTMWVRGTGESGSGSWPTPQHRDYRSPKRKNSKSPYYMLNEEVRKFPTPAARDWKDTGENVNWEKVAKKSKLAGRVMLPTPTAAEADKIPAKANYGQIGLNNHPLLRGYPTRPKATKSRKGEKMVFPTPRANLLPGLITKTSATRNKGNLEEVVAEKENLTSGQLNPTWVEWLMGYPSGWTDLKVSETQLSRTSPISSESDLKN